MANNTASNSSTLMEEAKHWMCMRRKVLINNNKKPYVVRSMMGDSWEEQAFAEDTAGPFGGFMWPPRSYSCSFCGREFRSAQALGGHMNVHRRDRARLKQQSPTSQSDANPSILDVDHEYPSRVYNSKIPVGTTFVVSSSSSSPSPSRVSTLVLISAQENSSTTITDDSFDCKDHEKGSLLSLKLSSTTTTSTTATTSSDSSKLEIREKNSSSNAYDHETVAEGLVLVQNTEEIVKFDSTVGLNLAMLRPYRPTHVLADDSNSSDDQEVVHIGCKRQRQRTDHHVALSLALSVQSTRDLLYKSDHFQNFTSSMEELDLELRLGSNQPT